MLYFSIALLENINWAFFKMFSLLFVLFFMSVGKMFNRELTKMKKKVARFLDASIQIRINYVK